VPNTPTVITMRAISWRLFVLLLTLFAHAMPTCAADPAAARPNVLWISLEDLSPDIGCYGDKYATTPVLDKLATESVRYTRCFTHAGVCAPSRSGIITGMYPPSITTQHMRCDGVPPPYVRCFTEYLRAAGYYCTNNSKTDYQFAAPITAWDENGNKAHWKNRGKDSNGNDQPFFAVFNLVSTHESQIRTAGAIGRKLPAEKKHDPTKAVLPPYYPDTPVVRQDWANYYDNLTATETRIAALLQELDDAGLHEETIVWFWGDHGRGLPRAKRWLYDSGVHAPLMIRIPEKWRQLAAPRPDIKVGAGEVDDELHAFVDFAPTMLSLCGLEIPEHLQGQAFLGPKAAVKPRQYVYGHRDRMDERYDLIRMLRDKRFKYLRNFRPDLPYAQHINYMDEMPTMQEWRRLAAEGKLNDQQKLFFAPYKPVEELYDTENDPHELVNLAAQPEQAERLKAMRAECSDWMKRINDTGLLPEAILEQWNHPGGKDLQSPMPTMVRLNTQLPKVKANCPGTALLYGILSTAELKQWEESKQDATRNKMLKSIAIDGFSIQLQPDQVLVVRTYRLGRRPSNYFTWRPGQALPDHSTYEEQPLRNAAILTNKMRIELDKQLFSGRSIFDVMSDEEKSKTILGLIQCLTDLTPEMKKMTLDSAPESPLLHQAWQEAAIVNYVLPLLGQLDRKSAAYGTLRQGMKQNELNGNVGFKLAWAAAIFDSEQEQTALRNLATTTLRIESNEFLKLQAAQVLDQLGEVARPALADIETASKYDDYAGRVCKFIVQKLKK
jgi:N-sulfoglucosamine sulfohydrolase